jgi:hypothetical protein
MPVTEQVQDAVRGGGGRNTAIAAAAAAAATGAATYAVKRARSHNGGGDLVERGKSGASSILSSAASSSWDAARDMLLPIAEDAAASAGKYLAENGPDLIKERIVPAFIEAFEDAK